MRPNATPRTASNIRSYNHLAQICSVNPAKIIKSEHHEFKVYRRPFFAQREEVPTIFAQVFEQLQKVQHGAAQTVKLRHHQRFLVAQERSQWVLRAMRTNGQFDVVVEGNVFMYVYLDGFTASYLKMAEECGSTGVGVVD